MFTKIESNLNKLTPEFRSLILSMIIHIASYFIVFFLFRILPAILFFIFGLNGEGGAGAQIGAAIVLMPFLFLTYILFIPILIVPFYFSLKILKKTENFTTLVIGSTINIITLILYLIYLFKPFGI